MEYLIFSLPKKTMTLLWLHIKQVWPSPICKIFTYDPPLRSPGPPPPVKNVPSLSDVRMFLLTGKITKVRKVRSFFCLQDRRDSRYFFKLGPETGAQRKLAHAYCVFPLWIRTLFSKRGFRLCSAKHFGFVFRFFYVVSERDWTIHNSCNHMCSFLPCSYSLAHFQLAGCLA